MATNPGTIAYNTGVLADLTADVNTAVKNMRDALTELETTVKARLSPETWEGELQQAFTARHAKWNSIVGEVNTVMTELATKVQAGGETMQGADKKAAGAF
ncbi:MAG: WXG100 family type VII secretion target [Dactylosporangium sp.]|nr:WXG100 family type VII secretion target [Dactylosporangium sp.]NNJ59591.1 WXG100 family type VII secretion target [Dactylosporangium sp.]